MRLVLKKLSVSPLTHLPTPLKPHFLTPNFLNKQNLTKLHRLNASSKREIFGGSCSRCWWRLGPQKRYFIKIINHLDKDDVAYWIKKSTDGGVNLVKRQATIHQDAATVDTWFSNQQNLLDASERLLVSEVVKEYNSQAYLIRREMKGNLVVSNRDLSLFLNKISLTDGSIAQVIFSVEHESIPETKCVRAESKINVMVLKSISESRWEIL